VAMATAMAAVAVGPLPKGYVHNVPLPRGPVSQITRIRQVQKIPAYYDGPYGVPPYKTHHSIVESAAYAFSPAWQAIAINAFV
jgi:hypothetical protein